MATNNIRAAFKTALIAALTGKTALNGVQISYGDPGDLKEQDAIWTAQCTGTISMNLLQAGRKQRDDNFTLTLVIVTGTHGLEPNESEATVVAYFGALEDVVANDPSLTSLDGLIAIEDLVADGPNTVRKQEGAMSWMYVTVNAHARYT